MLTKITTKFNDLATIYFLLASVLGLIMVFLIPPFSSPDETGHYLRAAALSERQPFCKNGQLLVSKKKINLIRYCEVEAENLVPKTFPNLSKLINYQDIEDKGKEFFPTRTCQRFPIAHIFPAAGIKIGNLLGLNELHSFYAGRIFNLLISITITALAIHIIPYGKYALATLGFLPTIMTLSSGISYDAVSIPSQFLFIAFTLYLREKKQRISFRQIFLILTIYLVVTTVKPGYQPLAFLLLILESPKHFKRKNNLYILIFTFLFLGMTITILPFLILSPGFYAHANPLINVSKQLLFISTHPVYFVHVIYRTIRFFGFRHYLPGFVGFFDWLRYKLNPLHYFLIIANLLFFVPLEAKPVKLKRKERVLLISIFISISLLIFTALYVAHTPVRNSLVFGVQGRYFIGISPLVLFVYYSLVKQKRRLVSEKLFNKIFLLFVILNVLVTIWSVFQIYYGNTPWPYTFKALINER